MGKISIEAKITFQDWAERNQHRCAVLKTQGTIKGAPGQGQTATPMSPKMSVEEGVFSGTSWFDPELGALVESDTDRLLHIKGEAAAPGAQPGAAFTLDLGQKLNMNLVELTSAKK